MRRPPVSKLVLFSTTVASLAGCSYLPASGPLTSDIYDYYETEGKKLGIDLVELNPGMAERIDAVKPARLARFQAGVASPADMIGIGDVLSISIFQTGGGLFNGSPNPTNLGQSEQLGGATSSSSSATSAVNITLPNITVDRNGDVTVPYGGKVHVAGTTATEAQRLIEAKLKAQIFQPQVLVGVTTSHANQVTLLGDIKMPAQYPIFPGEKILDAVAAANGPNHLDVDESVTIFRGGAAVSSRLSTIERYDTNNIALQAHDRIQVDYRPRVATIFGATGPVTHQIILDRDRVTLAEGIAQSSGPSDTQADIKGIFLFRFEDPRVVDTLIPGRARAVQAAALPPAAPMAALAPPVQTAELASPAPAEPDQPPVLDGLHAHLRHFTQIASADSDVVSDATSPIITEDDGDGTAGTMTASVRGASPLEREIVPASRPVSLVETAPVAQLPGPVAEAPAMAANRPVSVAYAPSTMAATEEAAAFPTEKPVPVIYHLNLADADSFFVMKNLPLRDGDLIYIADAKAVQLQKFFGLIGSLFQPIAQPAEAAVIVTSH